MAETGGREGLRRARERTPELLEILPLVKDAKRRLGRFRSAEKQIEAAQMDADEKERRLDTIRDRRMEIMQRVLDRWDAIRD